MLIFPRLYLFQLSPYPPLGYLLLKNLGMHALVKRVRHNVSLNIVPILECSTLIIVTMAITTNL